MNNAALNRLYSPKQQRVLRRYFTKRPFMIINHGAVRSGKTKVDNEIFLSELVSISAFAKERNIKNPQYILAGASINNIIRNVIREINQDYGIDISLNKRNEFELFGVTVCCLGTDDIGRIAGIVGMTSYGLYLNEASLAKEEVFDELLKRQSGSAGYAPMVIIDTNPDSPEHYLYKKYISLPLSERKKIGIVTFHWELDDNPFGDPQALENIKNSTPSGVFYDRKIKGLWVTADGIVYADFNRDIHVIDEDRLPPKKDFVRFFCGVDWGYEHKGAIVLFGVAKDGNVYILRVIAATHMLIDWWVQQAQGIIERYGYGIKFYCDSARPDNINEFRKANIWAGEANKAINAGVECVAGMFKKNRLFIIRDQSQEFCSEIYAYVWDERTGLPVKNKDDIMDAVRYGIYTDAEDHKYGVKNYAV